MVKLRGLMLISIVLATQIVYAQSIPDDGGRTLPVELVSFAAFAAENEIVLTWATATETDNYGFNVQRSISPETTSVHAWTEIGFVPGSGTSFSPKYYEYRDIDIAAAGYYYYRLQQLDLGGDVKYSKVVMVPLLSDVVEDNPHTPSQFTVYPNFPNPFNPRTTVSYVLPRAGAVSILVVDISGRIVRAENQGMMSAGLHRWTFDAAALPSGVYIARISYSGYSHSIRMLLLR